MGNLRYIENVVTLKLDTDRCTGCRMCTNVCPQRVFAVENGTARIADRNACMECGACSKNCPEDAISVEAGVGCATGVIIGMIRGTEPTCGCSSGTDVCC